MHFAVAELGIVIVGNSRDRMVELDHAAIQPAGGKSAAVEEELQNKETPLVAVGKGRVCANSRQPFHGCLHEIAPGESLGVEEA